MRNLREIREKFMNFFESKRRPTIASLSLVYLYILIFEGYFQIGVR